MTHGKNNDQIQAVREFDGIIAGAFADWSTGDCHWWFNNGAEPIEAIVAGGIGMLQSRFTSQPDDPNDSIRDVLVTLGKQYHLIHLYPLPNTSFYYLILDRAEGNLAVARLQIAKLTSPRTAVA